MSTIIEAKPLTPDAFAPFGEVIGVAGDPDRMINQGMCGRYHDRVSLQVLDDNGSVGVSLFDAIPRSLPYRLDMVERHPVGSQCFIPMTEHPFLVVVAHDENGSPSQPLAFITRPGQGVNYYANTWHGVLTPLSAPGRFAVVDRVGDGENLQEHWFEEPFTIVDGTSAH